MGNKKLHWTDMVRIALLIAVVVLIIYMFVEIEAVKLLAYDPCKICMEKTSAVCFSPEVRWP